MLIRDKICVYNLSIGASATLIKNPKNAIEIKKEVKTS